MRPLVWRRPVLIVLFVAGLLAGWAASAGALPPLPTVPILPQVPTLPLLPPPPQAPQVPPAPVPKAPAGPPVQAPVSQPALPLAGVSGTTLSNGSRPGSSPQGNARPAGSRPSRVYRLRFSRNWIARSGPKRHRQTVLAFTLRKAGLVEFVVVQIAPDCRRIGRFRVQGRAGANRVRFRGHVGRRVLGPGTYRVVARTLPRGRAVVDTKLVVVAHPARSEITSARGANVCGGARPRGASASASASTPAKPSAAAPGAQSRAKPMQTSRAHGVLGAKFTKKAIVNAIKRIPPWLYALLGLAIALLAVASLPLKATPTRGAAVALAHHRGVVALGGTAMLVAVTVAYALH